MKNLIVILALLCATVTYAQPDIQKKIQRQLILVEDGGTVTLDEGVFEITNSLSLEGKKNVTIKGQGKDKTILRFKNQTDGAEGLRVSNAENIVIEALTVQDAKGDAIKTMNVTGLVFRNLKTEWTGEPKASNGAYGLYPVMCQNILIENCEAIGASDAGIYVGQSKNIIVRQCRAYHNVAGIEIENSLDAEVYDNEATENTGGILVFDLPDLVQKKGGNVRVYRNNIHHNNYPNFAPPANIVANVPQGTGIMVLATNQVEIFDNKIINNNSIGTGIISYYMTEIPIKDTDYYPYPTGISIHDNVYERQLVKYQGKGRMGLLFKYKLRFGKNVPHIVWDGVTDDKKTDTNGQLKPEFKICVRTNTNATVANLDAGHDFKKVTRNASDFDCTHQPLTVKH